MTKDEYPLFDATLLYVHISNWHYQCCGDLPQVGSSVRGALTLYPSHRPGYPAPVVHDWDPDTGLVQVEDVFAKLGHSITDPYRTDLIVSLGWHELEPAPTVTGRIEMLIAESGRYRRSGSTVSIDPDTVEYRRVTRAVRWPAERQSPGGRAAPGVVAGIRVATIGLPSTAPEHLWAATGTGW